MPSARKGPSQRHNIVTRRQVTDTHGHAETAARTAIQGRDWAPDRSNAIATIPRHNVIPHRGTGGSRYGAGGHPPFRQRVPPDGLHSILDTRWDSYGSRNRTHVVPTFTPVTPSSPLCHGGRGTPSVGPIPAPAPYTDQAVQPVTAPRAWARPPEKKPFPCVGWPHAWPCLGPSSPARAWGSKGGRAWSSATGGQAVTDSTTRKPQGGPPPKPGDSRHVHLPSLGKPGPRPRHGGFTVVRRCSLAFSRCLTTSHQAHGRGP